MPRAAFEKKGQPETCVGEADLTCLICPGSLKDFILASESQVLFKASVDELSSFSSIATFLNHIYFRTFLSTTMLSH